ncbi:unnamed protein product [Orchesella dallaii]|uniref:Protein amnionless n=1 Tax=Orchesella dallaii TaxID=48710 RepID=A0ABP1QSN0_9HEXA
MTSIVSSSSKGHYIIITLILTLPHTKFHPFGSFLVSAAGGDSGGAKTNNIIGILQPPGPGLKEWRRNTNFGNVENWQGLGGYENCSGNIYSFSWYQDESVVLLPKVFVGKQILFPVTGHFVFQEGVTTFLSGSSSAPPSPAETTCHGREVKFQRTSRADWFDPDNWIPGNEKDGGDHGSEKKSSSLLNMKAIPHVERVPCQYDSVRFPANSSFNLKIESNVTISYFYVGNKRQSYNDVAILMNSKLGMLQFQKSPETIFSIRDNDDGGKGSSSNSLRCEPANADNDHCICSNYGREMKQKICTLAKCSGQDEEDECQNPITPHGFCCPICGVHMRIVHTGNLALVPLFTKLKRELKERKLEGLVAAHLTRYQAKGAHLIVVPSNPNKHGGNDEDDVIGKLVELVVRFQSILKEEREVRQVTMTESWERLPPSSGASDRSQGSALGGGLITLIVILLLLSLLAGVALFIFIWNKKHGYPPMTLSSVTSVLNRMPSMSIPIVPGRRSSTFSTNLHSFGFARFTNERASAVTISPDGGSGGQKEGGISPKPPTKSSSLRRTEQVDDTLPMTIEVPETVSDANSGAYGFSNVTYDLIGVQEGEAATGNEEEKGVDMEVLDIGAGPSPPFPILTIPEVMVVDVDESVGSGSTSGVVKGKEKKSETPASSSSPTSASTNKEKVGGIGGKFTKPSFVTSRMAKAYQKLGPEEEQGSSSVASSSPGESSGKGKKGKSKKAVKSADTNTNEEGKEDAHSKDQDHHRQQQQQHQHQVERVEQDAQLIDVDDEPIVVQTEPERKNMGMEE